MTVGSHPDGDGEVLGSTYKHPPEPEHESRGRESHGSREDPRVVVDPSWDPQVDWEAEQKIAERVFDPVAQFLAARFRVAQLQGLERDQAEYLPRNSTQTRQRLAMWRSRLREAEHQLNDADLIRERTDMCQQPGCRRRGGVRIDGTAYGPQFQLCWSHWIALGVSMQNRYPRMEVIEVGTGKQVWPEEDGQDGQDG